MRTLRGLLGQTQIYPVPLSSKGPYRADPWPAFNPFGSAGYDASKPTFDPNTALPNLIDGSGWNYTGDPAELTWARSWFDVRQFTDPASEWYVTYIDFFEPHLLDAWKGSPAGVKFPTAVALGFTPETPGGPTTPPPGNGGPTTPPPGNGDPTMPDLNALVSALEADINALGAEPIQLAGKVFPALVPYLGVYPANTENRIHAAQALEACEYVLLKADGKTPNLQAWRALLDDISASGTFPADYSANGSPVLNPSIGTPIFAAIAAYQATGTPSPGGTTSPGGPAPGETPTPGAPTPDLIAGVPNWILYAAGAFVALKYFKVI